MWSFRNALFLGVVSIQIFSVSWWTSQTVRLLSFRVDVRDVVTSAKLSQTVPSTELNAPHSRPRDAPSSVGRTAVRRADDTGDLVTKRDKVGAVEGAEGLGGDDVSTSPPSSGPQATPTNTRTFQISGESESAYCNRSYAKQPGARRCLVPSYPHALRADIRTVPSNKMRRLLEDGTAFAMFPRKKVRWLGRTFNNLKQVYSAVVAARACGMVVLLPRRINYESAASSSYVDCVDFRTATVPDPFPLYAKSEFCNISSSMSEASKPGGLLKFGLDEKYWQKKGASKYWHKIRDGHMFPLLSNAYFDEVRMEAKRAVMLYWGMRPGSYRCKECLESPPNTAVVYMRGADVFKTNMPVLDHKGQPPLDFYVKAVRHANATKVILLSSDYKNPMVRAFMNYAWADDGLAPVHVEARVGDPYETVLRLIWCASVLIMGNTSMNPLVLFSPNANAIYVGLIYRKGSAVLEPVVKHVGRGQRGMELLPLDSWNVPNEDHISSVLSKISDETSVYGYLTTTKYSPYEIWNNTQEQRDEMKTYKDGIIVRLN